MAVTTIETNNKLVRYTQEINREFCRENMFSPYMGEEVTSIIRVRNELKAGGETMNIPIVARLRGSGVTTGTLVGNEEKIDNYGMRLRVDWARHAVVTNKAESQKDSADIFGEAKPLLSDWGKELQRDEIIAAMMALPSETLPTDGRVHGIQFDLATAAQINTWVTDNSDRVLYGAATSNNTGTHETSMDNLDTTNDKASAGNISLLKRLAMNANPKIRPFKTRDGYEYFVAFCGTNMFRDIKADTTIAAANKDARAREGNGMDRNPIFQDGDQLWDGVIIRCVPEISNFVTSVWTSAAADFLTAGAADNIRAEPMFLCGQQAVCLGWGQMARPTERTETDYGFVQGAGIEMAYGVAKIYKKHPMTGTALKQWGMATGFFASAAD